MTRDELEKFEQKMISFGLVEEEIRKWEWRETKITAKVAGMPSGKGNSKKDNLLKTLITIERLEEWYEDKIHETCLLQLQFEREIEKLQEHEQTLMRLKYIEGMTYKEIANKLGYCERHTIRKHGKILAKIA